MSHLVAPSSQAPIQLNPPNRPHSAATSASAAHHALDQRNCHFHHESGWKIYNDDIIWTTSFDGSDL
jgi:hypothetical protein